MKTEIRLEVFNLSIDDWKIIKSLCENEYSLFITAKELSDAIGISGGNFLSSKLNENERKFVDEYYSLKQLETTQD